jgi:hypothetical protein
MMVKPPHNYHPHQHPPSPPHPPPLGSSQGRLQVWDLGTGKLSSLSDGGRGAITGIVPFTPAATGDVRLVTVGMDGVIEVGAGVLLSCGPPNDRVLYIARHVRAIMIDRITSHRGGGTATQIPSSGVLSFPINSGVGRQL